MSGAMLNRHRTDQQTPEGSNPIAPDIARHAEKYKLAVRDNPPRNHPSHIYLPGYGRYHSLSWWRAAIVGGIVYVLVTSH